MSSSNQILTKTDGGMIKDDAASLMVAPSPMSTVYLSPPGPSRSLASILEVPFMHKRLISVCALLGILLGWAAIVFWPSTYESEVRLKMRVGRESVSLDPIATTGRTLMLNKSQEEEIVSALEVLNSRRVAEAVVDKWGADAVLSGVLPDEAPADPTVDESEQAASSEGRFSQLVDRAAAVADTAGDAVNQLLLSAGIKEPISSRELAVMRLRSNLDIHSPIGSTVISISAQSATPEMAQAIADEVTTVFIDEHLKGSHTEGSFEFFQEQCATVEQELDQLVAARAKFMQDNEMVSIDVNRELLSQQLSGIDRDLALATGELEQVLAEVEDVKQKLLGTEDEIVAMKEEIGDETWSGMRQLFYELELQGQELDATLTEEHPRLKRSRSQIEGAKKILEELESLRVDESKAPNPIKLGLIEELQRKETQIVGLRSIIDEKIGQQEKLKERSERLLEQERHLTKLDRDIESKRTNLVMMREKLDEARVIDELHDEKLSNIHVFQPATFVERPVSPNKKMVGVGCLFLGLTMGLALAFLRQGTSPTLRTPEDVELLLGAPVVSTFPRLKKLKALRFGRSKAYRKICRELLAQILMSQPRAESGRGRSLGIMGVDAGVGASTLAANLAMVSDVDCHLRTVLVDADSRRRSISRIFGLSGVPGLAELLSGSASHDECLQKLNHAKVELISASANSSEEVLSSSGPEVVQALQAYLHDCDLLIVDLPAASEPDQAVVLAQHLDYLLIVVESEKTLTASAERLLNRLSHGNATVFGVVLTKTRNYLPKVIQPFVGGSE